MQGSDIRIGKIKRARLPLGKRVPLLDLAMFPLPFSKMSSSYQASIRERPGKPPEDWAKKLQVPPGNTVLVDWH